MNLRNKVLVGYFILVVLIGFMASILVRERHRISEIDLQNSEVQQAIRDIHNVHRYITLENIKSLDPLLYSKLTHQKNIRIK